MNSLQKGFIAQLREENCPIIMAFSRAMAASSSGGFRRGSKMRGCKGGYRKRWPPGNPITRRNPRNPVNPILQTINKSGAVQHMRRRTFAGSGQVAEGVGTPSPQQPV